MEQRDRLARKQGVLGRIVDLEGPENVREFGLGRVSESVGVEIGAGRREEQAFE